MAVTPAHIAKQIAGCSGFYTSQQHLLPAEMRAASMASMANSIAAQITLLSTLEPTDATDLSHAIAASCFAAAEKSKLAETIATKVVASSSPPEPKGKPTQRLENICEFLTDADWDVLINKGIVDTMKVQRVMDRLFLLGIRNPSERTCKQVVAAVAACDCPDASTQALRALVMSVKSIADSRKKSPSGLAHLMDYPQKPQQLPEAHFKAACTSDDAPVSRSVVAFPMVLVRIPMRKKPETPGGSPLPGDAAAILEWAAKKFHDARSQPPFVGWQTLA